MTTLQRARHRKARPPRVRGVVHVAIGALTLTCVVVLSPTAALAADTSPPTRPGAVTVSKLTATGASLTWPSSSDDTGIEGYRVYRGPAGAADSALALIATTDAVTSYAPVSLRSGYRYTFGVVAIDAANNTSPMSTVTFQTAASSDTTPPTAPSSSSVSVTPFSSTRIDLVWAASTATDVAFYEIYRDGALAGTVERPSSQRFSDNGLAPSSTHSYTIKAVDSAGNRSAATTAKSATTTATGVVKIARGPYLSNVTGTSAIVSWWTNIPTPGVVSAAGATVTDPQGTAQHHTVSVSGLAPGTSYAYTVTSGAASAGGTLRTAARPGQSYSFAAIGDFGGQSSGESANAKNIGTSGTEFIQTLGDNVYPSAGLPDPDFTTTYSDFDTRFYKQFGPVVKSQAFFPANGNKEYYSDGEFWANFPMPGGNHSWYSYNWGDAHILVLDSEQPSAPGTEQYDYAQADLAAHQADPWRIVAIQRPPYSSTTAHSSSAVVSANLVPLFQAQKVDLVLSGNSHNYERTFPLKDGAPVASGGITYVVSGAGGNGFNKFTSAYPQPSWSAFRESDYYQFAKVTVSPSSLTVAAVRADTNTVFDSTTITKPGADTTAPSPPSGLSVGATTASSAALSWSANAAADGVTGYNVYRNGALAPGGANVSGTSFTDTGLAPATTYRYTVTAVDAAGNESAPSNSADAVTGAGGSIVTVAPLADATIDPATSTPSVSRLKVDASSPVNDALLKFTVPSGCTVAAASLQLTVGSGSTDVSGHGGDFYPTSAADANAGWSEATVTWASAPAKDTSVAPVVLGAVTAGATYTLDVTRLVPATGTFTIRGTSTSGDGAGYFSKEGSTTLGPRLQLTCS
ncbi:MAG: fibronectin type III domain-containing protein [Actinomycetes bacterium]